ncbi:NlpC/P60 family protein [Streptomyces sp. NPDC003042]
MRARRLCSGLVTALVTALLFTLAPAVAKAAGTGVQNWCGVQGAATAAATRAIDAACAAWRDGTVYTWGGGHGPAPGPTVGRVDYSSVETIRQTVNDPRTRGFDCSGFVRWAWYQALGGDVLGSGNTKMMYGAAGRTYQRVTAAGGGTPAVSDLRPGDLVFTGAGGTAEDITHVVLYLGGGYTVEVWESGKRARVIDIQYRVDAKVLVGAIRIPEGVSPPQPGDGGMQLTWGTGVAVKAHPHLSAGLVTRLPGPESVRVRCQQHGERVTAEGHTNDVWSYLPDRGGWISNIYLRGPAWLPDVPICTGSDSDPDIGPGGGGDITQGAFYGTWGSNVAVMPGPSTTSGTALTRLSGPTTVKVTCQIRAQSVTSDGYTNDAWSYLPQYGGWMTNIYVKGAAWLVGVPACDGKGTSTPPGASPHSTWGSGVAVLSHPSTGSAVMARLPGPTNVAVSCQKRASTVTESGYTNNAWSYLPEYQGWISNIYMKGDAWLAGVPDCGATSGGSTPPRCTDGSTPTSTGARSPRTTTVWSRTVELRYSDTTECAWGRISNGSVGDEVWVDRSVDGGRSWDRLGYTRITSGREVFTPQFDDHAVLMRACGKAGDRVEISCTGWF